MTVVALVQNNGIFSKQKPADGGLFVVLFLLLSEDTLFEEVLILPVSEGLGLKEVRGGDLARFRLGEQIAERTTSEFPLGILEG